VLEVMRILEKEIELREETRSLEQVRPAIGKNQFTERAYVLSESQADLGQRVEEVTEKIRELPTGNRLFAREIALLTRVAEVMGEATTLLRRPDTGPETIAAESEAIELLLQTRRANPQGGGGGGGSSPGGGGGSGDTQEAALALLGSGHDRDARLPARSVRHATGVTGRELPAEFRAGLDAYFSGLEASRGSGTTP
jgi:hypothetical protein